MALLVIAAVGCSDRSPVETAEGVFATYQDALFHGDRDTLRSVLSIESREVADRIEFDQVRGKQRLEWVDATYEAPEVIVTVRDPNQGDRECTYVMVKERGRLVVDLIATTECNHVEVSNPDGERTFKPEDLSADEIARIRSRYPDAFR